MKTGRTGMLAWSLWTELKDFLHYKEVVKGSPSLRRSFHFFVLTRPCFKHLLHLITSKLKSPPPPHDPFIEHLLN